MVLGSPFHLLLIGSIYWFVLSYRTSELTNFIRLKGHETILGLLHDQFLLFNNHYGCKRNQHGLVPIPYYSILSYAYKNTING